MDTKKRPNEPSNPIIRTMRTDAELYAKEKKLSSLQINAAEYIKRSAETPTADDGYSWFSGKIFIIAAVLVSAAVLGGGSLFIISRQSSTSITIPTEEPAPPSFIANDGQISILFKETAPLGLAQKIVAERSKQFRSGALIYLPIKEEFQNGTITYISAADTIKALGLSAPVLLSDILQRDYSLFIFGRSGSNDIVLIVKAANFERAFSSMLEWEMTLARDWHIFSLEVNITSLPRTFSDEVIKNNDVRILKKDDGTMIVGYTIFNKKYITISSSREALRTALDRFIQLPPQ